MTQLQAYFGDTGVLKKAFCNVSVWTCRKNRMMASREVKVALAIVAAVAVAFAAYQAESVFAPLVLALFIIGITWPLQRWLQSRMPKLIALAITLIVIVAVGIAFASLVAWGFGRVGHALMSDAARYQALYDNLVTWLDSHGISVAGVWAEHFNVRWLLNKAQYVAGRINSTLAFWLITLTYVILGLLEVDDICRKVETLRNREAARVILDGSAATAVKFRKYLLVRTQMSVLTGLFVGLFALATGLQFAAEWGVIAFALNYSLHRPVHRHAVPDALGDDAVRHLAGRGRNLHLPQHHPIRHRQLCRAAAVRQRAGHFAVRRAVCDLPMDVSVGPVRHLHRRPDCARHSDILRAASGEPMALRPARRPAVGRTDEDLISAHSSGFAPAISTRSGACRQIRPPSPALNV